MYQTLLFCHSLFRWLVLASLVVAVYKAFTGYRAARPFSTTDNAIRHWTATLAHVQLTLGMLLYFQSPIVTYFRTHFKAATQNSDQLFFGLIHAVLMLVAVVLVTIGSATAKRKLADREKFKTMLVWFTLGLLVILAAIPWPFSPLAHRPYLR